MIRRILRRAVRYGYTFLGQKEAFIYKLVPALVDEMGDAFPEIAAQQKLVMKVMQEEESSFLRTLENGIKLLQGVIDETKAAGKTEIAGDKAFTLFDTFGFPLDLTELICREQGLTVDEKGFDVCMQEQKNRARNAAEVKLGDWISPLPTSPKGEESHAAGKARPIEELVAYFEQKGTEGLDEFGVAQTEELHFTAEERKAMNDKQKSDVLMNYRIAFMGETMVNWCAGLGTVLANDEVVDGVRRSEAAGGGGESLDDEAQDDPGG